MKRGKIIKSTGKFCDILDLDSGMLYIGIIRGKFKLKGFRLTNPVAVGDTVQFDTEGDLAIIKVIEDRTNYVVRQSPRKKHHLHLMASNIDQAILIVTLIEPNLKQGFIDRFLIMTEPYDIPVTILINKSDLFKESERRLFSFLQDIYEGIGYRTICVSALTGEGMENVADIVHDKTSLISGQSGVGKSSIINYLSPKLNLKTQDISDYSGKGQHTTTFAEMFELVNGGYLIDTPGIKTLSFNHLEVMDVMHNFREFFKVSEHCKFANCTHRNEPKCAVKQSIDSGEISELRYFNYIQILEEIENQNHWERIKDY